MEFTKKRWALTTWKLYKGSTKFENLIEFSAEESNTSIKGLLEWSKRELMPSLKKVEMTK